MTQECTTCHGGGLVQGLVCKICGGKGNITIVEDSTATATTFEVADEILDASIEEAKEQDKPWYKRLF